MKSEVTRLLKRITLQDGTRIPGAVSRIAEALDVSHSTVLKWLEGDWPPGATSLREIKLLLANRDFDFTAKSRGPKRGEWRWKLEKGRHVYVEA